MAKQFLYGEEARKALEKLTDEDRKNTVIVVIEPPGLEQGIFLEEGVLF